jgi:uncharacterized protein
LAEKHLAKMVPANIITNGYLMNAEMAQRLKDLGILQAQVTLDGPEAVHDSRRKLRNGRGTFQRIIENLEASAGIIKINVRVNIDKDNADSGYDVVRLLKERGVLEKVRVTFAPVTPVGTACADVRERCHDNEEFSRILEKIYRRLIDNGIFEINYPRVNLGMACGAIADGYYVVSPTGYLFKCCEDISTDPEKSIGSIFSTELTEQQMKNLEIYKSWQPLKLDGCLECDILPICMGGCPARALEKKGASCGACTTWKYNLKEMMELSYCMANKLKP